MPTGCVALNCINGRPSKQGRITFHKFPSSPDLVSKWVDALNLKGVYVPDHNSVVCSDHFSEGCFNRDGRFVRLRKGAVPDVFQLPARLRQTAAGGGERSDTGGGERSALSPSQGGYEPSPYDLRHLSKQNKCCITPGCGSRSWSTPTKLLINVPRNITVRSQWWELMGLAPPVFLGVCFCCEDHFEMEEEVENYKYYTYLRKVGGNIRMKWGVVPSIFTCQEQILKDSANRAASRRKRSMTPSEQDDGPKRTKLDQEKPGIDNNPSKAESEDVRQIKSEPEDGNCDDPVPEASGSGLEQATDGGGAEDASAEFDGEYDFKDVELDLHDSDDAEVVPEKAGTDNNPSEAESEDVGQIKSEPEDGNFDDPGVENVLLSLKMSPEIKQEVVEAATTSSSPANGADVLPGNDCNSESVSSHPGVESGDKRSVITDMRRYGCNLCHYSGKSMLSLKLHLNFHKGFRPFHCDVCPMAFERHDNLVAHRRTHPKETERKRTYRCIWCREQFTSLEAFKRHEAAHIKKKPFGCNKCPNRFAYVSTLNRHMDLKHTLKLRCDRCGKGFLTFGRHRKHQASCCESVLEAASDETPEQQAPRMDYGRVKKVSSESSSADVFSTESTTGTQTYLDSTPPRDAHEKPFGCIKCPKRFADGPNLSRHIANKHTQILRCDRCGKVFVRLAWYKKHQASCFEDRICVLETGFGECSEQQAPLSQMDYANCDKVSCQTVSADVFSTESSTGTQTCLDSTPSREDYATESVGAGKAYVNSVLVDSWRNGPKVDEMSPPENNFSIDSASEKKLSVDLASEELSSDLEDKLSDESASEKLSVYSTLDEQPSTDPLSLD